MRAHRRRGPAKDEVERELAEHPFSAPPKSTKAAAKSFRRGLTLGDRAWALGAEAFFREHAAAVGFRRIPPSSYRANHLDTFLPGVLAHVAQGGFASGEIEAFLVLTNAESYEDMGWSALVVDLRSAAPGSPGRRPSPAASPRSGGRSRPAPTAAPSSSPPSTAAPATAPPPSSKRSSPPAPRCWDSSNSADFQS